MSNQQNIDKAVQETIRAAGREAWRERFASYEEEIGSRSPLHNKRIWLGIAAGFLLVLCISWGLGLFEKHTDRLYAAYYNPYPAPPTMRAAGAVDQTWVAASEDYQQGNYGKAAAAFQQIAEAGQYRPAYLPHFYAAAALMALDSPDIPQIQAHLQSVLRRHNDYRLPAKWYLALSYLKIEEYELARVYLTQIAEEGDYKAVEAKELLDESKSDGY